MTKALSLQRTNVVVLAERRAARNESCTRVKDWPYPDNDEEILFGKSRPQMKKDVDNFGWFHVLHRFISHTLKL